MTVTSVDWKVLAPKRDDWMRLSAECEKMGIPRPTWLNGIPTGLSLDEMDRLESIAQGKPGMSVRAPKKPGRPVGWRKHK